MVRSVVVMCAFVLAAGFGCKKKGAGGGEPVGGGAGTSDWDTSGGSAAAGQTWVVSIDESAALDPRAPALMQWVTPLKKGSVTACSATQIGAHALLTAAHCVDGSDPGIPALGGNAFATLPMNHRACAHGNGASCADPFPVGEYARFRDDIATIWIDDAMAVSSAPALGRLEGYGAVPGAFMLSARTGRPHPVCNASASGDVGQADGWIEKGDSGSSVVALSANGFPVILGVVSHRWETRGRWYFAVIPNVLPWPAAAESDPPPITGYYDSDFATIQDCP